jgi:PAS domain S-box-containing protein
MTRASPSQSTADPGSSGSRAPPDLGLVVLEGLADPVYVLDAEWRILFSNTAYATYLGRPVSDLIGMRLWDILPPNADRAPLEAAHTRVKATGEAETYIQQSAIYPDRVVDVRVFPVFDGVGVMFRDVTSRVKAERALAESEEHLRRALQGADMGHWSWDARTERMFLSDRTLALYELGPERQGIKRSELRSLVVHPDDAAGNQKAAEEAHASQGQYVAEFRVRRGDGWRWMRNIGGPHIVDGELVGMHGVVQDIHERKLANERLRDEITERERAQQRQLLLIHELNHRVKNLLAMVQAIVTQTLSSSDTPEAARRALDQRLQALARAHDVLTRESWHGADFADIVEGTVAALEASPGQRVRTSGPHVRLEPKAAVTLAMALHELATNAVKYGALSVEEGWVGLDWTTARAKGGLRLAITWVEHGGPPVEAPERTGFGARLIARSLAAEQGSAELIYAPEGVKCHMALLIPKGPAGKALQPG